VSESRLFELALVEWGQTPDDLNDKWTDELLHLMLTARNERVVGPKQEKKHVPTPDFLKNANGFGGGGVGYERR
jgi:hypothetical protein